MSFLLVLNTWRLVRSWGMGMGQVEGREGSEYEKKGDVSRTTPVPLGTERIPGSFAQDMPPFRRFCCSWEKTAKWRNSLTSLPRAWESLPVLLTAIADAYIVLNILGSVYLANNCVRQLRKVLLFLFCGWGNWGSRRWMGLSRSQSSSTGEPGLRPA